MLVDRFGLHSSELTEFH